MKNKVLILDDIILEYETNSEGANLVLKSHVAELPPDILIRPKLGPDEFFRLQIFQSPHESSRAPI